MNESEEKVQCLSPWSISTVPFLSPFSFLRLDKQLLRLRSERERERERERVKKKKKKKCQHVFVEIFSFDSDLTWRFTD